MKGKGRGGEGRRVQGKRREKRLGEGREREKEVVGKGIGTR